MQEKVLSALALQPQSRTALEGRHSQALVAEMKLKEELCFQGRTWARSHCGYWGPTDQILAAKIS